MSLIAHWKFSEAILRQATTAIDSAAGGSGDHNGTYSWGAADNNGVLFPGGVGGRHLYSTWVNGNVSGINNVADLNQIHGALTLMFWFHTDELHGWYGGARYIVNCHITPWSTEADNVPWYVWMNQTAQPQVVWYYGATPTSTGNIVCASVLPSMGWTHITIKRYEISAGYYGVKFYFNGVLVDTQDNGGPGWPMATGGSNSPCYIGRRNDALNSYYCHYFLDSLRIYDSEESDANILSVYNAEAPIVVPSVIEDLSAFSEVLAQYQERKVREEGPFSTREGAGFTGI